MPGNSLSEFVGPHPIKRNRNRDKWSYVSKDALGPNQVFKQVMKKGTLTCNSIKKNNSELHVNSENLCFDVECSKARNSKTERRKMREVFNLGEKIENFVYLVEPYLSQLNDQVKAASVPACDHPCFNVKLDGLPLTCELLSHFDVMNYNSRVVKIAFGKTSEGMWNSMSKLGIANLSNECDPVKRLKEMERRDSKGLEVLKGNFYQPP